MDEITLEAHVLIFPFPAQGHVNSMLKLAELLCLSGLHVTFLVSHHIHGRLLRHADVESRFAAYPGFRFQTLPDELYTENPYNDERLMMLYESLKAIGKLFLRELLLGHVGTRPRPPVSCIIADGVLSFAIDIGEEFGVPIIFFRTSSPASFWSYFCLPRLIKAGELPFRGGVLDEPVVNVKGMEGFLRRRDLPSFCRASDISNPCFNMVLDETQQTRRVQALILNTFEDLDGPILSQIRTYCCPNVYTLGPLHAHLKSRQAAKPSATTQSSNSLWEEDRNCIEWLDKQPSKSVIYVSFGSITILSRNQLLEFWHGIVDSGKRFLWVVRPESVIDKDDQASNFRAEMEEATKARGYMLGWAPQEQVLAHPAVGGFLTHSGWNSTLESIIEGVPMICWSYFADQQVNSRFVSEVWKLGLDIKDTCDRSIVEKAVRELMEERSDEFQDRARRMAKLARDSIGEGGSSCCNLNSLIHYIRSAARPEFCLS